VSLVLAWTLIGLVSGFIASSVTDGGGHGLLLDLILGIIGAFVAGVAFSVVRQAVDGGVEVESLFASVLGAALLLSAFHTVRRPRSIAWPPLYIPNRRAPARAVPRSGTARRLPESRPT